MLHRTFLDALPSCPEWDEWLRRSGESPDDILGLPEQPDLPLLEAGDVARDDWRAAFTRWFFGDYPDAPAELTWAESGYLDHDGARSCTVTISSPSHPEMRVRAELLIPTGGGPFPVFMTQRNHREWAIRALRRGYLCCVINTSDDLDDSDTLVDAWAEADWSRLRRRAWAASRAVDMLLQRDDVRPDQIAFIGHSRNGKQAIIAAAYDERIAAVIGSSPGAGGSLPARLCTSAQFGEGIEAITRRFPDWFHPRLRFFAGREALLPVDLHQLVALIAPRSILLSTAPKDPCEVGWAMHVVSEPLRAYFRSRDAAGRFDILWREGIHEIEPHTLETYLDWLDHQFRSIPMPTLPVSPYANVPISSIQARTEMIGSITERMTAALGASPPSITTTGWDYGREPSAYAAEMSRTDVEAGVIKEQTVLAGGVAADIYRPDGNGDFRAGIVWLGPWPSTQGYRAAYWRGDQIYVTLARAGYAVLCFDHIGTGRRAYEMAGFDRRYPEWSLLGALVADARAAVDVLMAKNGVDRDRIAVVGYGVGATVAAWLAAQDDRVAQTILVAPPALSPDDAQSGCVRMAREALPLLFARNASSPVSMQDLVSMISPRPVRILTPETGANDRSLRSTLNPHHDILNLHNDLGPELQQHILRRLNQT